MKFKNILLFGSFFISAMVGFSMEIPTRGGNRLREIDQHNFNIKFFKKREQSVRTEYHAILDAEEDEDMVEEEKKDGALDFSQMTMNQKIQEAEKVANKWKTRLNQDRKFNFIDQEKIQKNLEEINSDLECLRGEKSNVTSEEKEWGLKFSEVATRAIEGAEEAARFYITAVNPEKKGSVSVNLSKTRRGSWQVIPSYQENFQEVENPKKSKKTQPTWFFKTSNPLNPIDAREDDEHALNVSSLPTIKTPTLEVPLKAKTVEEILTTWKDDSEIRYNKAENTYISSQPRLGFWSLIRLRRSRLERDENREAIEQIAKEFGMDRSSSFKNNWRVRCNKILGEPITPKLIKAIKADIDKKTAALQHKEGVAVDYRIGIVDFLNRMVSSWRRSSSREQYQEI